MALAREAWRTEAAGVGGIGPERLVFLDECGVLTDMARLQGRSPRGARAHGSVLCGHWTRLTVLGALGSEGAIADLGRHGDGGAHPAALRSVERVGVGDRDERWTGSSPAVLNTARDENSTAAAAPKEGGTPFTTALHPDRLPEPDPRPLLRAAGRGCRAFDGANGGGPAWTRRRKSRSSSPRPS